ncbi:MAG TPA: DUF2934 domain-containing protein [Kofleriaceae bacterium]|jgi:hypothetical protein
MSTTKSNKSSSKKTVARKTEAPAVARRPSADAPLAPVVDEDQVAALAYRYYVEGGYQQGHALDHWLRAETELRAR